MRYPPDHKQKTRAKILEAAGKVFRRNGYHASGVDSVMQEAGLTAGGFYAHFDSKEALLAEALALVAAQLDERQAAALDGTTGRAWVEAFLSRYLRRSHVTGLEQGCPLAALVSEVSRSDEMVKRSFEAVLGGFARTIASHVDSGESDSAEGKALAIIALCVGGLGLARSVENEAVAAKILDTCRHVARHVFEAEIEPFSVDRAQT
jgi:TetR/AcrR family transcriptional regulator, transcriptional repressor for nem operon